MGASHSSRREGIENTVEYKEGKKLQELRDKLFPPADSREFLKDKVCKVKKIRVPASTAYMQHLINALMLHSKFKH